MNEEDMPHTLLDHVDDLEGKPVIFDSPVGRIVVGFSFREETFADSTETGNFMRRRQASSLRDEDDADDTMGAETDPCSMGEAERFFRRMRSE